MMQYIDTIMILTTVGAVIFLEIRKQKQARKEKDSVGKKLEFDMLTNAEIYPLLWDCLTNTPGARRVAITQFHNGGKYFSGNSINRMTMTHEVTSGSLAHISKSMKDLIIQRPFSIVIDEILENTAVAYNDVDKIEEEDLKNYLKFVGAKSMAMVIMRNSRDQPIGTIHIASDSKNIFSPPAMEGLKIHALQIGTIFENGNNKKKGFFSI